MLPTHPESRLKELGITLPESPKPVAAYIPSRRVGTMLYISGQIPVVAGTLMHKGSVPSQVSIEHAQLCARQCAINALAVLKSALGDLGKVVQVVRLGVFVCSEAGFTEQPKVANGASELMVQVFGDAGRHARAAVGSIALPLGAPVEVEMLVEVRD
jgi:enamine deaminase RidA (YjgF/YER057c/UK114 family)